MKALFSSDSESEVVSGRRLSATMMLSAWPAGELLKSVYFPWLSYFIAASVRCLHNYLCFFVDLK